MESMERNKECSVKRCRKLPEGERVEVRQSEIGLRGSWHPAKVVKVKHGRRVVEYEDLFTLDGTKKLCESIRLFNDLKHPSPSLRPKNGTSAEKLHRRGLIRPIPPPCSTLAPMNRKSGLLVDAFYDGAWWEGILLDDVLFNNAESKVKVFFPDEGDELQILANDVRVSQEWDEELGDWEIRGFWPFYSEDGKSDVSSLQQTDRNFSKALWRQKRLNDLLDTQIEELKKLQLSVAPFFQKQLNLPGRGDEYVIQEKATFCHDTNFVKEGANQQVLQEPLFSLIQPSLSLVSSQAHACDETKQEDNGKFRQLTAQQTEQDLCSNPIASMQNKYESVHPPDTPGAEGKLDGRLTGGSTANCRVTRNTLATGKQQIEGLPLSRLHKLPNGCSQHTMDVLQEQKLLVSSSAEWLPNSDLQPIIFNPSKEIDGEAQQADFCSSGPFPTDNRPSLNMQKKYFASVQDANYTDNGTVLATCSIPHKVRIRRARLAAKQCLLNAGWTFDVRNRARGPTVKQEAVYVSPSGSRFFSLAAACRGSKSCEKNLGMVVESRSKELELLNAYHMPEDIDCLLKPTGQQAKVELAGSVLKGEDNTRLLMVDGKLPGLPSSPVSVSKEKKKKAEKQKKRKSEVLDITSPQELKRKRGRLPLKKGGTSLWHESKGSRGRGGCRMQVLLSLPGKEKNLDFPKDTGDFSQFKKSTVLSWLMDKGILKENESVSYINRKDGHVMKKGHVTREGVICDCCKDVFTLSNFEAHAGSKLHRPSANTFLDDGRSISDCQLEACALQDAKENQGLMEINDDTCCVCGDGGEIVLCDHCPLTFHAVCIGLEVVPEGDWYCPRCSCGMCGSHQLADQDLDNTMHHCVQCELLYHIACAHDHTILASSAGAVTAFWFCSRECREIFTVLRGLVGLSHPIEGGFAWTLLRSMKKDQGLLPSCLEDMAEHHSKLSVAHGVMQECFVPMIDRRTNINLLSQALYNRRSKIARLNYAGFYTILLEKGDEVISVATIRVHGARLAEMPLVGTRFQYRRQGMCRRLINVLEEMLKSMGVKKLILPAVPELLETWMGAFEFQKISLQETQELSKLSLMTFPGTTLLQKHLPAGTCHTKFLCLPHLSDKADKIDGSFCTSVEDFFTMARASLDSGLLDCPEGFLIGGSIKHPGASSNILNERSQLIQPCFPIDPQTPSTIESSNGYSNMFWNCGKSKSRSKIKHQLGSSGDEASLMNKVQNDDDINTRVVIATTRSNRLVKSRRWVADGLKELKIAKQSKRTSATAATCPESAVDLECDGLLETLAHLNNVQEGAYEAENFYIRTRRKRPPVPVESAIMNQTQVGEAQEHINDVAVDSLQQNHSTQHEFMMDPKSSSNGKMNMHGDEGFEFSTPHKNGLCFGQPNLNDNLGEELSTCPNFYSRRKKRECMHSNLATDLVSKETIGEVMEGFAQEQTSCMPVRTKLNSAF